VAAASPGGAVAVANMPQLGSRAYAGFWLRFVAAAIDGLLFIFVMVVIGAIVVGFIGIGPYRDEFEEMARNQPNPAFPVVVVLTAVTLMLSGIVINWLYHAGMESAECQATLGKMALALVVTDTDGQRISFARASGRYFAKIITGAVPLWIGWIMAGFTEKKQALHDMIASCLVLRKI
jgi:uncharacterized RDD family membrane protein YckC